MKKVVSAIVCLSLMFSSCGQSSGKSDCDHIKAIEADPGALAAADKESEAAALAEARKLHLAIGYDAIDKMKACLEYNDFKGDEYIWFTNTDERTYKPVKAPYRFFYNVAEVSKEYWWILINRKSHATELFVKEATLAAGPSIDAKSRLFFIDWGTSASGSFQMYNLETGKKYLFRYDCVREKPFFVNDTKKLIAYNLAADKDSAKSPEVDSATMQVGIRVIDFDGKIVDSFFSGTDGVLYGLESFSGPLKYRKITVGASEKTVELSKEY